MAKEKGFLGEWGEDRECHVLEEESSSTITPPTSSPSASSTSSSCCGRTRLCS